MPQPEPWLRGPIPGIPALLMPVALATSNSARWSARSRHRRYRPPS